VGFADLSGRFLELSKQDVAGKVHPQ